MTRPAGFTLLELLLASALTTMLMVAVLGLVAQSGHPADQRGDPASRDAAVDGLIDALRSDLEHAVAVRADEANRVELLGHAGLDAASRERSHRPVRIVYRIEEIDGRRWLLREQRLLDVLTNRNTQRDLVAAGVESFELTSRPFAVDRGDRDVSPAGRPDAGFNASQAADSNGRTPSVPSESAEPEGRMTLMPGTRGDLVPVAGRVWRLRIDGPQGGSTVERIVAARRGGR